MDDSVPSEPGTLRRLVPSDSDASAIHALAQESPEAAHWSQSAYNSLLEQPGAVALAIESGGELAGFLVGKQVSDQADVFNLVVKRACRRKGAATTLLSAALREFASRGAKTIYLEVRESNTAAIAFYLRHGFAKTGRREHYYRQPDEAALTMMRKLTA